MKTIDDFAIAALTGLLANERQLEHTLTFCDDDTDKASEFFAKTAYKLGKAMLEQRQKICGGGQ